MKGILSWRQVGLAFAGGLMAMVAASPARANINLELRPSFQSVFVGNTVSVDLYAVSDSAFSQSFAAVEVLLNWNTTYLSLLGADMTGSPMGISPGFALDNPYGLNASLADGDAKWVGFAPFGPPIAATTSGTFVVSFDFQALSATSPTTLINIPTFDMPNAGGGIGDSTKVYDGTIPNFLVTGTLSGATVQINNVPAPGGMLALLGGVAMLGRRRRS